MMAYTMRYAEEVRKPEEYFGEIKKVAVHEDQLALAKELIQRKVAKFDPEKFTDEYESALREMVEAKVKHAPLPKSAPAPKPTNVVNLMDALRKSVQSNRAEIAPQDTARSSSGQSKSKKMALVAPSEKKTAPAAKKPKKLSTKRRSA
jgi:DNA end-binding protein Ku